MKWKGTVVAVALLAGLPSLNPVAANPVQIMPDLLPGNMEDSAAASTGDAVYVFGGLRPETGLGGSDEIVRIDAATGAPHLLDARLPQPRYGAAAVWDGQAIYVLGGEQNIPYGNSTTSSIPRDIVRFDPATQQVTTMPTQLPWGTTFGSAAWDGKFIDLFGCDARGVEPCRVVRYRPGENQISLGANMTGPGTTRPVQDSAVFADGKVYLIGGTTGNDRVFTYDPVTDVLSLLPTPLVVARGGVGLAYDGTNIFVVGGVQPNPDGSGYFQSTIIIFNPATGMSNLSCLSMPALVDRAPAAYAAPYIYVPAADTHDARHIYRFRPSDTTECTTAVAIEAPISPLPTAILDVPPLQQVKTIDVAPDVRLVYDCVCSVAPIGWSAPLPSGLPVGAGQPLGTTTPLPVDTGAVLYVAIENPASTADRVRIELNASAATAGQPMSVHYYNGAQWVDLSTMAQVPGATPRQDLQVYATGFDADRQVAWAVVNHTSVYALGPRTAAHTGAAPPTSSLPDWTQAWPMFGLVGLLLAAVLGVAGEMALYRTRKGGRSK